MSLKMCVAAGANKNALLSLSPDQQVSALEDHGFQRQLSIIINYHHNYFI
jgi:hypothetical protein